MEEYFSPNDFYDFYGSFGTTLVPTYPKIQQKIHTWPKISEKLNFKNYTKWCKEIQTEIDDQG